MKYTATDEEALMAALWDPEIADDLHKFVLFAYPWGKAGTPLEHFSGPRGWQVEVLDAISDYVRAQKARAALDLPYERYQEALAAGRGIGKSALVAMIAHWHMTTRIGSTTYVSANTEPQLKTTTFPEIKKWFSLALNAHWFDHSVLSITPAKWYADAVKAADMGDTSYHFVQARLWSEENPDAYAGPHSQVGMALLWDESSGIPDSIAHVAKFFFTDVKNPCRLWLAASNPRRNSGFFYNCFHERDGDGNLFWKVRQIDSRTVEDSDKSLVEDTIRQYGIDSDVTRVEVLGQFPAQDADQFISNDLVLMAQQREVITDPGAPLMMGVDVSRSGKDFCVVRFRQGPDARSIPAIRWQSPDLYVTAERVAAIIDEYKPDAVCIDQGMGAGVIDILRRRKYRVHEVMFGGEPSDKHWMDKRTEMYAELREWLRGGCLDKSKDNIIFTDLTAASFLFAGKGKDRIKLEPKENFRSKIGHSPDDGDALALTFAVKVARRDLRAGRRGSSRGRLAAGLDYPIFG